MGGRWEICRDFRLLAISALSGFPLSCGAQESGAKKTCRSEKFPAQQWLAPLKNEKLGFAPLSLKHAFFGRSASSSCATEIFQGGDPLRPPLPTGVRRRKWVARHPSVLLFLSTALSLFLG